MSNYPDNFTSTNMDERDSYESDAADDELERIVQFKRELLDILLRQQQRHRTINLNAMIDMIEEAFDDAHGKVWLNNICLSGDLGWPNTIPPRATLSFVTPKQRADREWAKRHRIVSTNPTTWLHEKDEA